MSGYIDIGKKIYNLDNPREVRRMAAFVLMAKLHSKRINELIEFFNSKPQLKPILEGLPFPIEQPTRAFFYKGSTFSERCRLIREHYDFLTEKIQDDAFLDMSLYDNRRGYVIWESEFEEQPLRAVLITESGQRKEGCLSIELNLGKQHLYQIMFWIAKDKEGNDAIWIGALQGPNMEDAKELVKRMTKFCHGYRTKNLILYMLQAAARAMEINKIYAVTNEGYYANNHVRLDRKLKTSFSDFWAEAGGEPAQDSRFYILPLIETRKTMEEVPTRKRAVYRRRFAFLYEVDDSIGKKVRAAIKSHKGC